MAQTVTPFSFELNQTFTYCSQYTWLIWSIFDNKAEILVCGTNESLFLSLSGLKTLMEMGCLVFNDKTTSNEPGAIDLILQTAG